MARPTRRGARSKLQNVYFERRWGVVATGRNLRTMRKMLELTEAHRSAGDP